MSEQEKHDTPPENRRRRTDGERGSRLAAAGISVPLAVIINHYLVKFDGSLGEPDMQAAVTSLIGSLVTILVVCFYDVRGLILSQWFRRRRRS